MESLEIIVLPTLLVGALLEGAVWGSVVFRWIRNTEPVR
jgi:hypothetical protein